jgi:hypothetical protein
MKILIAATLTILFPILSFSQRKSSVVKINSRYVNSTLEGYLYNAFLDGKVISKDGTYGKAKLNFNCLTNEMIFITPKNDTLKLARPEETSMVTIASDTFCFFKNTFLLKITHYAVAPNLFQRQDMRHVDDEKMGAYGYSSLGSNSSTTSFSNGVTTQISEDKNMVFKRNGEALISNDKNDFFPIKQATFNKLFPKYRTQIKTFVVENKLDLEKQDDIIQVVDYIQKLQSTSVE